MVSSIKKQTFERIRYSFIRIIYTNVQVEKFSLQEIFTTLRRNLKTYDFEVFVIGVRKKRIEIFIKSVGKSFDFKTTRIFTTNLAFLISGKEKFQVCGTKQVEFDEFLAGSCIKGSVLAFDQKSWEKFCVHQKKIEKTIRYNIINLTTGLVTPTELIKNKIDRARTAQNKRKELFNKYLENEVKQSKKIKESMAFDIYKENSAAVCSMDTNLTLTQKHIWTSDEKNPFLLYKERLQQICKEVKKVLNSEQELEKKQIFLENLDLTVVKEILQLNHKIPKSVENIIQVLNHLLKTHDPRNLSNENIFKECKKLFLINPTSFSSLDISHFRDKCKQDKPRRQKLVTFSKIILFFEMIRVLGEDIGVFLVRHVANQFRNQIDAKELGKRVKKIQEGKEIPDTVEVLLKVKRTKLLEYSAGSLIHQYIRISRGFGKTEELKMKQLYAFDNLVKHFKEILRLEEQECTQLRKIYYFSEGCPVFDFNFTTEEKLELGKVIFSMFENMGLLNFERRREGQKKRPNYSTISTEFLKESFNLGSVSSNMPCIFQPRDWSFDEQTSDANYARVDRLKKDRLLIGGGFLSSKREYYPAVRKKKQGGFCQLTATQLNSLNYLQRVPWKISNFLNFLKSNYVKCLLLFVKSPLIQSSGNIKKDHPESIFSYDLSNKILELKSEKQYILGRQKQIRKTESDNHQELSRIKKIAMLEYLTSLSKVFSFLEIFHYAELLKDHKLFFVHSFDYRLRMYPIASLLSPQGRNLSKALLEIYDRQVLCKTLQL